MPAAAYLIVVAALLIVAFAALGLIRVIFHLRAVLSTLRATTGGVRVVAELTQPVPPRLTSVNEALKPVRDFCEGVPE
ncbi:MAG: hypothetical protein ABSA93_16275 [Streptosporangiaceae bacterium]|jgi:hypothetical protein